MMTRVTALGCALTGVTGAFLAVEPDPLLASAYALALFGLAGEMAASGAIGPQRQGQLKVVVDDQRHAGLAGERQQRADDLGLGADAAPLGPRVLRRLPQRAFFADAEVELTHLTRGRQREE